MPRVTFIYVATNKTAEYCLDLILEINSYTSKSYSDL